MAYVHTGVGDEYLSDAAKTVATNLIDWKNYQDLKGTAGFSFLSSSELGLTTGNASATWWVASNSAAATNYTSTSSYDYDFKDGFYGTDLSGSPSASFAAVGKTQNALFVTFRGTDKKSDITDDVVGMHQHYAQYGALTAAIDAYLLAHTEIKDVYVTGHSLGGEMATLFVNELENDARFTNVDLHGVVFNGATKLKVDNNGSTINSLGADLVNFRMPWDLVSRLGDPDGFAIDLKLLANDTFLPPALFLPNHSLTPLLDYLSAIDGAPSVDGFTDPSGLVAAGDLAGNVYPTLDNIRHQYILPETSQAALVKVVDGNALIINGDRDGAVYSPEAFGLNDNEKLILPDFIRNYV